MRLHRLRLRAFGPFADDAEIDFDELSAAGLHLIHGPTGAGKTSILDAVCFAIYGDIPGSRRRMRETLVSDHAGPEPRPFVELEFSVDGRRLRVHRTPAYTVAKKKGVGMTQRQSSIRLEERRGDGWHPHATRHGEAEDMLQQLIGMGLDQFAQVVLLPQGEFAAFLRAKPDERGAVLERLFDIARFRDVEDWLVDERKRLTAALADADREISLHTVRTEESLAEAALADEPQLWRDLSYAELPDAVAASVARAGLIANAAMAAVDTAAARHEQLRGALHAGEATEALRVQGAAASAVVQAYDDDAAARHEHECRVEFAEAAVKLAPLLDAVEARTRADDDARATVAAASAVFNSAGTPTEGQLLAGSAALDERANIDQQLAAATAHRATTVADQQSATASAQTITVRRTQLEAHIAQAAEQLREAEAGTAQVTEVEHELALTTDAVEMADLLRAADHALSQCTTEHDSAAQQFADAEAHALHLRSRRLAGIVAELAGQLVPDQACPVCGSVEHPAPASGVEAPIETAQVEAAEAAAAAAHRQLVAASTKHGAATALQSQRREQLQRCVRALCEGHDVDRTALATALDAALAQGDHRQFSHTLQAQLTDVEARHQVALAAVARTDELRTATTTLTSEAHQLEESQQAAAEALSAATALAQAAAERVASLTARRDEAAAEHDQVCPCWSVLTPDAAEDAGSDGDLAPERHQRVRQLAADLRASQAHQSVAATELQRATSDLHTALADSPFSDAETARAAMLPATELRALTTQLRDARDQHQAALGVLALPEVAAAIATAPADLDQLRADLRSDEQHLRDAERQLSAARRAERSLQTLHRNVTAATAAAAPLQVRLAELGAVADAVTGGGDNTKRMRLTSYVLAARLETVTALANEKLRVMTSGRFALEHTDARAKSNARSGLGLRVRDAWTGRTRDTASLSGGEVFIASLALALGLGDAVLETAGGRQLETLLVDEGFGSLDERSLELVMEVLDDLRAGGRMVGIVSHVPELRSRIPAQVEVHKTENGSRIRVHTALTSAAS